MEDKKRKKEDKRKRDASQKVAEQKNKVPDSTKPTLAQSSAAPSSASPSPGPAPSASPLPAGAAAGAPSQGGNNAKRPAASNGQPPTGGTQAPQRYMPREVPPRFRCQQDHKVLLKRGQPPLSCMLLGGGAPASSPGDGTSATVAAASDCGPGSAGSASSLPHSSSSSSSSSSPSVAASSTISSSNYANSTWGASSGSQPLSQGWEKVIVDRSDMEEWPSILGASAAGGETGGAPWGDRHMQQHAGGAGKGGPPSPLLPSCPARECTQLSGVVWGGSSQASAGGGMSSRSKGSALPGTADGCMATGSGTPGANFTPNANPSAWPALVQDGAAGVCSSGAEGGPSALPNLSPSSQSADPSSGHLAPSLNPVGHQHQPHQVRDAEPLCGEWGGMGPKKAGLDEGECGPLDGGELATSLSSSSSSCRALSFSSNPKTGASKTCLEDWEGGPGGGVFSGEGGGSLTYASQEGKEGIGALAGKAWGAGSGGTSKTAGVSQGAWGGADGAELSVGEWGSTAGAASTSGPSNQVAGGSSGVGTAPATRAWDNQKGAGDDAGGDVGEWGGQGKGNGGGASSSSGGGHSRAGGGPHNQHGQPRPHPAANPEVALQNLLSRTDLDPRVLSNTGWGQTQIRQNVAWDLVGGAAASAGFSSSTPPSSNLNPAGLAPVYPPAAESAPTDPSAASHLTGGVPSSQGPSAAPLPGDAWDGGSNTAQPGRGSLPSGPGLRNPTASTQPGSGGPGNASGSQGKAAGGWGGIGQPENLGKGWGSEGQEWRERRGGGGNGWGDFGQQGTVGGGGGNGWGVGGDEKGGGWKDKGREGSGWGQRDGSSEWEKREPKSGGWGEGKGNGASGSGDANLGTWGGWEGGGGDGDGKAQQGWGGKGHSLPAPGGQAGAPKGTAQQQQSQPTQQDTAGGWGRPGGPPSQNPNQNQNQNQSSGWTSGPVPQLPSSRPEGPEPSGWEEPSPQSINRKMEIDDGTSVWGDPSHYNHKSVNLWDKNGAPSGQGQQASHHSQQQQQQQQGPGRPTQQPAAPGNRESSSGPGKNSGMAWGNSGAPSSSCVDNGTAAWGKPTDAPTSWGDLEDPAKPAGWGHPSPSTGPKSMQDGWGEADGSVSASRHSSWEEDEESGGGVWSSTGSQCSSSSYNSGGWSQGHTAGGKKANSKGALKGGGGGGDSWIGPMSRQFSNIGLLGEDPGGRALDLAPGPPQDKKLDGEKRGISPTDYNGEMRKVGRGGGGTGPVFRPGSKEACSAEPGPYYDKAGGHGAFGSSGGMAPSRGVHQPGVPPINPSPGIRAQVPHQFLSPQVSGSVLKPMPPPSSGVGGVGAGVFPAQLSPQHLAMLSSIYPPHIQFQLACQLLLQQQQQQQPPPPQLLQNQRRFSQNLRQQSDPQQLARIMAVLQQQKQQQQVGGPGGGPKLSPSHMGGGVPKQTMADPLPHPGLGGSLAEQLHQKTQGAYPGFSSGVNLSGLEMGSMLGGPGGMKDGGGQQSRFKWLMEGHSPNPPPPDTAPHKNGPMSTPMKLRGGSPYSQYELLGNDGLGVPPPGPSDNWHRTPGKMGVKAGASSWPPEFQPGVPWKGIQSVDPESDPNMTPSSVLGSTGTSSLNDNEHQLLRDNAESNPSLNTLLPSHGAWPYSASDSPLNNAHNSAKYTEYKPSWPPDPIGHNKLWKAKGNSSQMPRPPPGLTHQKQPSVSPWAGGAPRLARGWGGSGGSQDTRYGPGSAWSDAGTSRSSCWLLLSNLTPQIDGSTLRTICMQHGPLLTFHLGLTQGSALIRYSSRQEAAKAQSALHMCVLGNTTILAEFVNEEEVGRYFAHSQVGGGGASGGGGAAVNVTGAGGGHGPSGTGAVGGSSGGGSTPGSERERERAAAVAAAGAGSTEASSNGGGSVGTVGPPCSGWQGLDGTGSSPDPSQSQGTSLGLFAQWSSNGSGGAGGMGGSSVGGVEPGRQGLWGGMAPGYPSSSLWGAPPVEDRHQMGSPAALLPGDLLGGGADSI
uniref:Trinucleotide repeat-containing gene 6B protein-like n=1 Tax=Paramormyrops kingsleyae TaxID=1676925 RepID=A0A3B3RD48_9TELE|nr:trinucleotide repeat-containing gene 6B protein-like [Paramormyrops kingsleyae]